MKTTFETLLQDVIPEINFLTASGAGIKPGTLLESIDNDKEVGYLPNYIKDVPAMKNKNFTTIQEAYDLQVTQIKGSESYDAAIKLMDILGLNFDKNLKYKIDFEIEEMTSKKFGQDLDKISFEISLGQLRKTNKKLFKKIKGYYLVFRVLYANKYKVSVEVEKDGGFEADVNVKNVKVEGNVNFEKENNTLLISHNSEVPFGVIGYMIKARGLK
jgi:hypothetical protein